MANHNNSSKNKRLTVQGLLAVSVVGLGITAVVSQLDEGNLAVGAQVETVEEPSEAMDLSVYSNVMLLRRHASLQNVDLAAIGMTQDECEAVLGRLVTWCESNADALAHAKQALYKAERELEQQNRLVRIGQASASQLRDAGGKANAVANAQAARQSLMQSGAEYALQSTPTKATAWRRASAVEGDASPELRYLSTMSTDRLSRLETEAKQRSVGLEQALSNSERQDLKAVRERINSHISHVLAAEEVALPLPVELRVDDDLAVFE